MKPQKQLFRHRPEAGVYGDCHRTAIAIALDMEAADVPHFMDGAPGRSDLDTPEAAEAAHDRVEAWLNARGLCTINVLFPGTTPLDEVLRSVALTNHRSKPVFILGGMSKNGVNHSVVACDGEIACDPSLDDSGIVGPCDDGFYWVTFFGALEASDSEAKRKRDLASERDRLDAAAARLSADLLTLYGVRRGDFYITIGTGELHVYAAPRAAAVLERGPRVRPLEASGGVPIEWHVAMVDVRPVEAEAAE